MQCKHHADRKAEQFCGNCGIPICEECAEEVRPGEYECFQCAMLHSVSEGGDSIKEKRERAAEEKVRGKKKWGPFRYFVVVSSLFTLVMWGVIIFGGQKSPAAAGDFVNNERVFLFMVNGAIKRYAHYEGNKYPELLTDLIPKYLSLKEDQRYHLERLSYHRDLKAGYRLSLAKPKPGEMHIILSPSGIEHKPLSGEGA